LQIVRTEAAKVGHFPEKIDAAFAAAAITLRALNSAAASAVRTIPIYVFAHPPVVHEGEIAELSIGARLDIRELYDAAAEPSA